jgi:hypothetical protein
VRRQVKIAPAHIVINGVMLSPAQAMTIGAALGDIDWDERCGDDEIGRRLAQAYRAKAEELLALIARSSAASE